MRLLPDRAPVNGFWLSAAPERSLSGGSAFIRRNANFDVFDGICERKQPFGPRISVGPRNTAGGVIVRTLSSKLSLPEPARIPVSNR